MNVAFLFNSNAPEYGGYYGGPIMDKILATGVLRKTNRHMRIFLGDVLTYSRCKNTAQIRSVYVPHSWDKLKTKALEATHNKATVFCWLIQNITKDIANQLHRALARQTSYLGALDINFAYLPHFCFFKNGMIEKYRLHNGKCYLFYSMAENEGVDVADKQSFEEAGFEVHQEDSGARHTIFDNYYDSLDHHKRIAHFEEIYISTLGWNENDVSELTLNLEELHPYLFNILFAATRALQRAEVKEELSQAYLSGRRFMEHLADFLYPPSDQQYIGRDRKPRDVKQDDYKNRLAAYIEATLIKSSKFDKKEFKAIGTEMARLYELFCKGVHKPHSDEEDFDDEKIKCSQAFSDLGRWLSQLIEIDPASIRRPYLAYNKEMIKLFTKASRRNSA